MVTPYLTKEQKQYFMLNLRLWQYALNDTQIEEIKNSLYLLCGEAIKVYKANKFASNPPASMKLTLAAPTNTTTK